MAEVPCRDHPSSKAKRSLKEDLQGLKGLFAEEEDDHEEEAETDDEAALEEKAPGRDERRSQRLAEATRTRSTTWTFGGF